MRLDIGCLGCNTQLVGPEEIRELCPLIDVREVLGALYDPMEGHLDPYGATHAFAKAARLNGAEIYRHTRVTELNAHPRRRRWNVVTDEGTIVAQITWSMRAAYGRER